MTRNDGNLFMVSKEDQKFLDFWSENREKRGRLSYQLSFGFPIGLLFAVPILVNFLLGRFWYKRADAVGASQFNPLVLDLAVLLIASFAGVIYKKFQWERNEERYLELTRKKQ